MTICIDPNSAKRRVIRDRVTARERINGVEYVPVLEKDGAGRYREVRVERVLSFDRPYTDSAIRVG
jgi:hypothetical protein